MQIKGKKSGFTIVEMLLVVAVMAIIATLAIGAIVKSLKSARHKRINATVVVLEAALNNYRAQQNKWPFRLSEMKRDNRDQTLYWATGPENAVAFEKLLDADVTLLGDTSALLTKVNGHRISVKQALEENLSPIPIGYPNPDNTDDFRYFRVRYNSITDSVNVYTQ